MARREAARDCGSNGRAGQLRCAIYTRKSTEEGLEQDFNSLDAQREACAAFIRSQKSEGWVLVPVAYDDGGISGGTLGRPALQRLLADIREGRVDIVVVYKVDRLTRSLADFAKLVETFDAAGASFVSVTQAFNTSTSMGRLTLNMLLSFAQFEREVTAERIRDKIAASKQRGMWMGGPVPLGYDAIDRKLVINEAEAETVRRIYDRYLALGAIRPLKVELGRAGIVSKARATRTGRQIGRRPFTRGTLTLILRNPLYVGEVQHKGERFPGQQAPIVDRDSWDAVQRRLDGQRTARRLSQHAVIASPLAGMLFDAAGRPLTPSHAAKGPARIRYRYYISNRLMTGRAADHPEAWRLPAEPVEQAAREMLAESMRGRDVVGLHLAGAGSAAEHQRQSARIDALAVQIGESDGSSLRDLLMRLEARIEIAEDALTLSVGRDALAREVGAPVDPDAAYQRITTTRPLLLRKRGVETKLVLGEVERTRPDPALVQLLADAHDWMQKLRAGTFPSIRALARDLGLDHRHVTRTLPLAFLAPDIVTAILEGRQPVGLTVRKLERIGDLPVRWDDQRIAVGMALST